MCNSHCRRRKRRDISPDGGGISPEGPRGPVRVLNGERKENNASSFVPAVIESRDTFPHRPGNARNAEIRSGEKKREESTVEATERRYNAAMTRAIRASAHRQV